MKAIKVKEVTLAREKSIAKMIPEQFSSYIRENYPDFITFVQHYYTWLEQEGNIINQIYSLPEYLDIDKTKDEFLYFFTKELMPTLPDEIKTDKRKLLKHIKEFYLRKGTEDSIKFLFRILFNEEIEVEYPSHFILRCSDGEWNKTTSVKVPSSGVNVIGRKVFGFESGSVAVIDNIETRNIGSYNIDVLQLADLNGAFLVGEEIYTKDDMQVYNNSVSGQLRDIKITTTTVGLTTTVNKGTNYYVGEMITLPQVAFSDAILLVTEIDEVGGIVAIKIFDTGLGYVDSFTVSDANGKGAEIYCYVGGTYYDKGTYASERGKLSSICVLQDSHKYQEFSYVIKSSRTIDQFKNIVQNTVHPAGTLLIGEFVLYNIIGTKMMFHLSDNVGQQNIETDIVLNPTWITVDDLERNNPGETLDFYYEQILSRYLAKIQTMPVDFEIEIGA